MATYESNDLYQLRSEVRALRATVDEAFRTWQATINAIQKKLREEEDAKWRKEHRNMIVLAVFACTMWVIPMVLALILG